MTVKSLMLRLFGFPATLITADTMVLDRWLWLKQRLPARRPASSLLEVGCGSGAFTIGAARLGFNATGLSWDVRNQSVAAERARVCGADKAKFLIRDARKLEEETSFRGKCDVVLCLECVEHILDDEKLMKDLAACLTPGGTLLLTTPNIGYRPLTAEDDGPWSTIEDGGHVRRGYSETRLRELGRSAGLTIDEISYCSGFISQKLTALYRIATRGNRLLAWLILLPLRPLVLAFDPVVTGLLRWPRYSICVVARKESHRAGIPTSDLQR